VPSAKTGHFRSDAARAHFLATYQNCVVDLPSRVPTGGRMFRWIADGVETLR
jgi:hypothetical protein